MFSEKSILIVDDNAINRKILRKILSDCYYVTEAANGEEALAILSDTQQDIFGIMLDLLMPVMDGYTFLQKVTENPDYKNIPVIVTTGNSDNENEVKALKLGAWDFVSKPYHPEIIKFRLKNAIDRSQLSAFHQLKYLTEYDVLTGIYNKSKFYECTRDMLRANVEISFAFIRFDIDRFQLINSFFGMDEGDKLLRFIAESIQKAIRSFDCYTYGRMESDVFSFCVPYQKESAEHIVDYIRKALTKYNPNYDIVPSFGIYVIEDNAMEVETMFNYASLAAKRCKASYIDFLAYYTEDLSETLMREQEITNEMNVALDEEQFQIYLQPKYNLQTNQPEGAEALVRWLHPKKGMISPGEFIPLFERNGFITKLDYYVWEKACKLLRKWIDTAENLYPISVNVSRVNMYNPNIADVIIGLVEKYEIPPQYLNLELTESAYTDNPAAMKEIIKKLQNYGFIILMDDFGSGYSSLNILKDISVDVLKLDILFLTKTEIEGRGENIIASVIRMAKWLNIPVVVEGVEKREQVVFLRSIGCDYVQGFYFAKPMTASDYDVLISKNERVVRSLDFDTSEKFNAESLFKSYPQMEMLLSDLVQAIAIYEFNGDHLELLRVNEGFYDLMGPNDLAIKLEDPIKLVAPEHREVVLEAFRSVARTKETAECDYLRKKSDGSYVWIQVKLKYIQQLGEDYLIFGTLQDITAQKEIDVNEDDYLS